MAIVLKGMQTHAAGRLQPGPTEAWQQGVAQSQAQEIKQAIIWMAGVNTFLIKLHKNVKLRS